MKKNYTKKVKNFEALISGLSNTKFELIQISTFMRNRLLLDFSKNALSKSFAFVLGLLLMTWSIETNAQCTPDGTSPVFSGCANKVIALNPGQCSVFMQPSVYATDNCPGALLTLSHNTSTVHDTAIGCDYGETKFYQFFTSTSPTPTTINSVDFGHNGVIGIYNVRVNVYLSNGSMVPSNWELIGGGTAMGVTGSGIANAPTNSDPIQNGEQYVIEIIEPSSITGDHIVSLNSSGQNAPTFLISPACGVSNLTDVETLTVAGTGAVVTVNAEAASVIVTPSGANTYETTDQFSEGVYNLSYTATDAAGNTAACAFTLTVNGVASPVTSISCNDLVNVSLDENCEAVVGPDDVLEGGPYSCYDDYEVIVYNTQNQPIGDMLDASLIGLQLKVEVVGPNTNRCWGEILVEDKNPPILDCFPVYTTCSSDLEPGSALSNNITYDADLPSDKISAFGPSTNTYEVEVFGLKNVVFNSVSVAVNIDHDNVSELSGTLEAPDGSFVNLFFGLNCTNRGIFVTLDDAATRSYADLVNECGATAPAVMGDFNPLQPLSSIMPQDPTGTWKITITDNAPGNGGIINGLSLIFNQNGGRIPFPTMNNVISTLISPNTYRVNGLDPCGPATVSYIDEVVEMDCDSRYLKIIDRTWNAVDASGNEAIPCVQKIYVYRNGLATLQFPPNYDGIERPSFSCSEYGMTIPPATPAGAGYPTGDFCENIQIFPPEDTKIDICAKSYKLIRKWKVLEWCSSQVIEHTQIIKVEDKQGPQLECQPDMTLSTDPLDCSLDYTPERPDVSDYGCSDENEITLNLSYYYAPNGVIPQNAIFTNVVGNTIFDLPVGMTFVRYTATDDCGNISICDQKVTVRDEVPPVAVCDQFTVVSVGSDGTARVDAITFDDLSHDNCELVSYEVRKMSNRCQGENLNFDEQAIFCCEEVGTSIMVALRVTDKSGNSNTCMVEAKIEDKLPPYISCPDDITIDCFEDYTDLDLTGEPEAIDNCEIVSLDYNDSGDVDNCGEGTIRRTWTVKDKNFSASCTQIIELIDMDPFEYRDIDWPDDYDATTCMEDLNPENLPARYAYPRFPDKHCSLVSYEYKDQVFTFVDGSCEKILRTWTVIDWCTYEKNNPGSNTDDEGIYTDLQIIKLTNNQAPDFISCEDKTAEVFGNCRGDVTQGVAAIDDCTPDSLLKYSYEIDIDNDDTGADLFGNGDTFTRDLPIGKHKVTWEVSDMCGNTNYCVYILTVVDGKKPTPYCLTTVTTVVMPSTGAIEIWASDFDYGSYDNCTPQEDLIFTFTSSITNTAQTFTCDDIPDGQEMYIPITMYVHDAAGNKDFCSIGLILQDGIDDVCDDITRYPISGRVVTESNEAITNTEVMAVTMGTETMISRKMTEANGSYSVDVSEGDDVNVLAEKSDDIMNGISTLDLVLIQRHILALNPFNSPYKVIAADVSNDGKVSASDLVALRKVILGIESTFPNDQKVWRFVDKNQSFNNPAKPFPFHERLDFNNVYNAYQNMDFVGMKIGDVNNSVKANAQDNSTENRSDQTFALNYDAVVENGYTYLDVYSSNIDLISGLQLVLNAGDNEIIGIESGLMEINQGEFHIENGSLKLSYTTNSDLFANNDEPLFKLIVKNETSFDGIFITERTLNSEAYSADYEVKDVTLSPRQNLDASKFELLQNKPNPFAEFTSIQFVLPEAGVATLEVFDVTGKKVYTTSGNYPEGQNTIEVYTEQLGASGVLYYQLSFGQFKAVKKMVNVK